MLGLWVVVLSVVDILLKRLCPRDVVNLGHVVAVQLQCSQELVEPKTWVSSHLCNTNGRAWRLEGTGDDNAGNVIDGDHVDSVVNVRAGRKLNTSLDHTDKEVIGVRSW